MANCDDAVRMMVGHARECLELARTKKDDRFFDGVVTGICVSLNCLGAVDELRALEALMTGRAEVPREEAEMKGRGFDRDAVIRMAMAQAEDYFRDGLASSSLALGSLMGVRACLVFLDADDEAKLVTEMIAELTTAGKRP